MKTTIIIAALLFCTGFIFWKNNNKLAATEKVQLSQEKKHEAKSSSTIIIKEKWELPAILSEVSGIAYIDEQRFACIQDEDGIIFIYNIRNNEIEKQIPFAGPGDYEGISLNGNTAYIVRSDGNLYEVDMQLGKTSTKEYKTSLTAEQNVEGLFFDQKNNMLLLAIKENEPGNPGYKGVYGFDLRQKKFITEPVFKIDLNNELLSASKGKKNKSFMPSEIAFHPLTNEIFITDGVKGNLLILDDKGSIKKIVALGKEFEQAEGISFSPHGEIFISNEGSKRPANIMKVQVN